MSTTKNNSQALGTVNLEQKTMTSLQIAKIAGKPHNDVMKSIRNMEPAWEKINEGKFSLIKYKDSRGRQKPMYSLTYEECLYIASKFNDEVRARIIKEWSDMKKEKEAKAQKVQEKKDTKKAIKELKTEISAALRQSDKKIIAKQTGMTEGYVSDIISPDDFWGKKDVTVMDMAMTRAVRNKKLHSLYYSKQGAEALTHFLRTGEFKEMGGGNE